MSSPAQPNLNDFCGGPNDFRKWLQEPFAFNGFDVATDGHTLLCRSASGNLPEGDVAESSRKPLSNLLSCLDQVEWMPAGNLKMPEKVDCSSCAGTGKSATPEQCPECEGEGEVEWWSGFHDYFHDCKTCDGDGFVKSGPVVDCEKCGASGKTWRYGQTLEIQGVNVQAKFIARVIEAPDLEFGVANNMLAFRAGEFRGLIMPYGRG